MANAKAEDITKAQKMLDTYLPDGSTIYHSCVGRTESETYSYRRVFTAIDGVRDGQGRGDARVVNLNLYIANLLKLRRDAWGNIVTRYTASEIATMLGNKLGRKINDWNL